MSKNEIVKIHIDKELFESPNPTVGAALYSLGKIDATKYDLWKTIPSKSDDELIPNDSTEVNLKNGDHFYSAQKNLNPGSHECKCR